MKKKLSILIALVMAISLLLVPAVAVAAVEPGIPEIDGVIATGEWDDYYLGTSVTTWSGGMSVDVYGFADDTYLYAAYVADMAQPGWSVGAGLGVSSNPAYWTPSTTGWPDEGHTILGFGGDGIGQTDGSSWNFDSFGGWGIQTNEWANEGIEYYVGDGMYNTEPNPNVVEVKIPLSLLTYADTDDIIGLGGQFWGYNFAEPFFVTLPANTVVGLAAEVEDIIAIKVSPTNIDFGTITPGTAVSGTTISVENIGQVTVDVRALLDPIGGVFQYLKLNTVEHPSSGSWSAGDLGMSNMVPTSSVNCATRLVVPANYSAKGVEETTLIFLATPK